MLAGLWPVAAAQEEARPQAQLRPVTTAAISAASEQKLRAAFEHIYGLEFEPALDLFAEVARAEPESATVRAFWTSALLYEILARQGSLQSQLFVTTNEFLKHQRLPPDRALDQRFRTVSGDALALARRRLKGDRQDADALFAAGLIYGNQANYSAGVEAKYFDGLHLGEKAYDYHKRLRKLRPEIHDPGVVLGVHDYVLGSLPPVHRFFLFFAGVRGSRERGLAYLKEAATQGEFLRSYAQVLLVVAYIRQQQLDNARALVEDLRTRYPRNPIFALELAKLYRQMQRYPEAEQLCRSLLAELLAHPHNPRVVGPEDALLELGLVEDAAGDPEQALESLGQVEHIPEASPRVWARALLERGKILDRLGRREQARGEYEKVIRLAAYPEVTRLASAYLKRAFKPDERN